MSVYLFRVEIVTELPGNGLTPEEAWENAIAESGIHSDYFNERVIPEFSVEDPADFMEDEEESDD